jgi:hypothetical protein
MPRLEKQKTASINPPIETNGSTKLNIICQFAYFWQELYLL